MKIYQNGDRCPCCGKKIDGMSAEWLEVFSQLCHATRMEELETVHLEPIGKPDFPPPDAGINPPVNPKI